MRRVAVTEHGAQKFTADLFQQSASFSKVPEF
jgi:hypothetical protein